MEFSFKNIPIDIVLCIILSFILLPISFLNVEGFFRIILGIPFIIFIPGYVLIFALFPTKKIKRSRGIGLVERVALSFGLSLAIVPLIGLGLNYSPWGIRLESYLLIIFTFNLLFGLVGINRWFKVKHDKRYVISFSSSFLKTSNRLDYIVNVFLVLSVLIAVVLSAFFLFSLKETEKFTEFLVLDLDGNIIGYPRNLSMSVNDTVSLSILNNEYETMDYTIEVWLINQSYNDNVSVNVSEGVIQNMWFMGKINASVEYINLGFEEFWVPQWQSNFSYSVDRNGSFKLMFLLFVGSTDDYVVDEDYVGIAVEKIKRSYRDIHIWIDVFYRRSPVANFSFTPSNPMSDDAIIFTSSSIDPDSRIVSWEWDFGDGNNSYGYSFGLDFDGFDDYLDCGNNMSLHPVNGTIESSIFLDGFNDRMTIFTGRIPTDRRFVNFFINDEGLFLVLTNDSVKKMYSFDYSFELGVWYCVGVTWDGSNVRFYVDGIIKKLENQTFIPMDVTTSLRIGGLNPPSWPEAFNGTIRDVKFYGRGLNSSEIESNYNGNFTVDGLVSWWNMSDKGNIVYDIMGRNNGTIYGARWINQVFHKYDVPGTYLVKHTVFNEFGKVDSISKYVIVY